MSGRFFRVLGVCVGVTSLVLVNACSEDCSVSNTCGSTSPVDDGGANGDSASPDGGGDVIIPAGCDLTKDAKDSPNCVASEVGIFVDATTGNDGNSGSKELPVKTIAGAQAKLAGRPRIYVCEGTYPESVKLTSPVSIYGGFACTSWSYTGVQPKVSPGVAGAEAFVIENVKSSVVIADMHADAAPGDATKKNSIAIRIVGSTDVKFVGVKATAAAGHDGETGATGSTFTLTAVSSGAMTLSGNPAAGTNGTTAGAVKTCTCSSGKTTSGGSGGGPESGGQVGGPDRAGTPPKDGAAGAGMTTCNGGGNGHDGADAPTAANAVAPTDVGGIEAGLWMSASGARGADGLTGQGGGGGGGRDSASAGGGGGCGGCGGSGGGAGGGGGASIAILAIESSLSVALSTLITDKAGAGGKGGAGGAGGNGGAGAGGGPTGCLGGEGGKGGTGGAGSGGGGGIAVGLLYKGTKPTVDAMTEATIVAGSAGEKGIGGIAGVNDGPDGRSEKIFGL